LLLIGKARANQKTLKFPIQSPMKSENLSDVVFVHNSQFI